MWRGVRQTIFFRFPQDESGPDGAWKSEGQCKALDRALQGMGQGALGRPAAKQSPHEPGMVWALGLRTPTRLF
jgi:hypothetical protein